MLDRPPHRDERIAELTKKLDDARARIEVLEQDVAALKSTQAGAPAAKPQRPAKPAAVDPVPIGSRWRGKTFGRLGNNQPVPNNGGAIEGAILSRLDDAFTLRIEVRTDLVFTVDCKLVDGKWQIEKMDANPAGAGRPGPIPLPTSRIQVSNDKIEIYVETPSLGNAGLNKITYQLGRVS